MRTAVYGATRNLYFDSIPSIKSLLMNSNVERIIFLAQDSSLPFYVPDVVEVMDVSKQPYFSAASVNFENVWTFMILLRAAYAKLFPDCDRVLALDCDTIVNKDISELWEIDFKGNYYAAVEEHTEVFHEYSPTGPYYNAGVMLYNLNLIRKDGIDDMLIGDLSSTKYHFCEQDCINRWFSDRILPLPSIYNDSLATGQNPLDNIKIAHFAGTQQWQGNNYVDPHGLFKKYKDISWEEVMSVYLSREGH